MLAFDRQAASNGRVGGNSYNYNYNYSSGAGRTDLTPQVTRHPMPIRGLF
jgi:hypothetical protein